MGFIKECIKKEMQQNDGSKKVQHPPEIIGTNKFHKGYFAMLM